MSVIFKIGNLDLSDYIIQSSFNISTTPVYSGIGFTNILGQEVKEYLGDKISISAGFDDIPDDLMKQINDVCAHETVTVTYEAPDEQTAEFGHPSISESPEYSDGTTIYWSLSLSAVCSLKSSCL